jgi:hypothetical protein
LTKGKWKRKADEDFWYLVLRVWGSKKEHMKLESGRKKDEEPACQRSE